MSDHVALGDAKIGDLGANVVEHARVLAHCTLGFARGTGGEVDVRELVGCDVDRGIAIGVVLRVHLVDEEYLNI